MTPIDNIPAEKLPALKEVYIRRWVEIEKLILDLYLQRSHLPGEEINRQLETRIKNLEWMADDLRSQIFMVGEKISEQERLKV